MRFFFSFLLVSWTFFGFSAETTFLLARHGETDWNKEKRVQGFSNPPLNAHGIMQAKYLAEKLFAEYPDISCIYSSDLQRAYATALETAQKFHLEVEMRAAFRELNNGEAEGLSMAERDRRYGDLEKELSQKYPNRKDRWNHNPVPGSETMNELLKRVKEELIAIAVLHPGKTVAVFAHGRVVKALIADSTDNNDLDLLPIFPPCGMAEFVYSDTDQVFRLVKIEE